MDISAHRATRRSVLLAGAGVAAASLTPGFAAATPARPYATVDYPKAHFSLAHNFTAANRPHDYPIDLVVIHVTQETFQHTLELFADPDHDAAAHYVVRSADGYIAQCVHEHDIAWHAGNWDYNTRSVGIEHEGWVDDPSWFTDAMYAESAKLTGWICHRYGIRRDRDHIIGHSQVPGSDHTDPGPYWDWDRYIWHVRAA
jgi:N-acetyl-anhydromuramyl-L-alanine amidase AmpD